MSLALLRHETGPMHKALEEKLKLFQTVQSRDDYAQHLARLYQWLKPLETKLKATASSFLLDWPQREKSAWIEADLGALGVKLPMNLNPSPPACENAAQCVGTFYVLEGSSLGAQIISRHFAEKLGLGATSGLRYFSGYGAQTGIKWREFLNFLESYFSAHPEHTPEIIEGACAAFRSYGDFVPSNYE